MKEFTRDNVTYSVRQKLSDGIQYQARYENGQTAWVFIKGKKHTREQVIYEIEELNARSNPEE